MRAMRERPVDGRIDRAIRGAIERNGEMAYVRDKVAAQVVDIRLIEPEAPRRHVNAPGDLTMGQAVARALAFVALITLPGIALLTVAIMAVMSTVTAAGLARLGGAALVVLVLIALITNRTNHSGACPGVVTHCRGCKR